MQPQKIGTIKRLINATLFSVKGIRAAWRHETAFRQEALLACVLTPVAFWLGTSTAQRALLIFSLLMVLIVELLNSAVEAVIDRIGTEHHPKSELAKNMASAAVLLSLAAALLVWGLIIWKRLC
jgi:diacylglycerol kinase (ATP)